MWLLQCPRVPVLEHPRRGNVFLGFKTLLTSPWQHFYRKFPLILAKLSWKTSLLVRSYVLGLFGNTLTADDMYFRHYLGEISATFSNAIVSKNRKLFLHFYLHFRNLHKIFHILKKKISFIA